MISVGTPDNNVEYSIVTQNGAVITNQSTNLAFGGNASSSSHQESIGETGYTTSDTNTLTLGGVNVFSDSSSDGVTTSGIQLTESFSCFGYSYAFNCTCCNICNICNICDVSSCTLCTLCDITNCVQIGQCCGEFGSIICQVGSIICQILDGLLQILGCLLSCGGG